MSKRHLSEESMGSCLVKALPSPDLGTNQVSDGYADCFGTIGIETLSDKLIQSLYVGLRQIQGNKLHFLSLCSQNNVYTYIILVILFNKYAIIMFVLQLINHHKYASQLSVKTRACPPLGFYPIYLI